MKLASVRIPRCLRGDALGRSGDAQALFDVELDDGVVGSIVPAAEPGRARGLLLSGLVDAHTHIDKGYTVQEAGAAQGNLFDAIARMEKHRAGWSGTQIEARMQRAVHNAWQHGTRALRTHLDWPGPQAPASLAAFERTREAWRGRMELQFVSLTPLDVLTEGDTGRRIAQEVSRAKGVLGAFIYRNDGIVHKLGRLVEIAQAAGLALDLHVDEGLDADATGLRTIAQLAIARGMRGIVCAHACSLTMQDDAQARDTLALCAQAGIHLVALPTTNLYLQGAWDRTPVARGITRIHEAAAHGMRTSLATDNVQDAFYPYGSYDLLETFGLGVQAAHLAPALDWLDAVTVSPARALGLDWDGRLAPGCPADLLLLAAADEHELLDGGGRRRTVIRNGQTLDSLENAP